MQNWTQLVFSDEHSFAGKVRKVFEYQFNNNPVYRRYCEALQSVSDEPEIHSELKPASPSPPPVDGREERRKMLIERAGENMGGIPLLPIRAFKETEVSCMPGRDHELLFKSSGTGSGSRSSHPVWDPGLYRESVFRGFSHFYDLEGAAFLGYAPGYSVNPHSSLIRMIRQLIERDSSGLSRFLPLDEPLSQDEVDGIKEAGRQLFLFGAAFGLVDLAERSSVSLPSDSVVLETGGMKTRRREVDRMQLHRKLAEGFGLPLNRIHSEYGMAELLSQAYATGGKWFRTPPWMKVTVCNPDNPRETLPPHREGKIGVIDLANVHSCSFILTGDRGIMDRDGRFQVLGRWNPQDLRGCNFLIDED